MGERIVIISLGIRLYASNSLKDKRRVRQKLAMRLKDRFNISIKETGNLEMLNYLSLTAAHVAIDAREGERFIASFRDEAEAILLGEGELVRYDVDMIN
ncbi:MAG: DUF503 family protein [Peptoniphilus sp.]|nr:DUF503 family protein [Peptoniphilus sp.]MDD7363295.1 DUF503 family protein [Bacillota bacterium]MDY6045390.1 DUF503 family protein [Peptoniphilus sp.]